MRSLQDFHPLKPAEEALRIAAAEGGRCAIADRRPGICVENNEVRGEFIRFLALGGGDGALVHEGGLRLSGAYITGRLNLDGCSAIRPMWLEDCVISSTLDFYDADTKVISLDGSLLHGLRGDRAKIDGSLLLRRGFVCEGAIRLPGATIGGTIDCRGAEIRGRRGPTQNLAIDLSTATVQGNLELSHGFSANGLILLNDAKIGGLFDCTEGTFGAAPTGQHVPAPDPWERGVRAMKCHRLILNGSLYFRGSKSEGELSLAGAEIGGDIDCRRGHFRTAGDGERVALNFTRIDVSGNLYMSEGFEAFGKVQLNGARIRSNVVCRGGTFSIPDDLVSSDLAAPGDSFSEDALSLVNAEIGGALIFAAIERNGGPSATLNGSLDLKSAYAPVFVDDAASWPRRALIHIPGELRDVIHLDGFVYDRFAGNSPVDAASRKRWLQCQPPAHLGRDFKPQPFAQAIKVLKATGHTEEARSLAIEQQVYLLRRRIRQTPSRALGAILWAGTFGILAGYGYKPMRLFTIMALVGFVCGFIFKNAAEQGAFAPRDPQVVWATGLENCRPVNKDKVTGGAGQKANGNWAECGDPSGGAGKAFAEYTEFNPWLYSLDLILPLIDMKQYSSWLPIRQQVEVKLPPAGAFTLSEAATMELVWAEHLFGWLSSLLAIAVLRLWWSQATGSSEQG